MSGRRKREAAPPRLDAYAIRKLYVGYHGLEEWTEKKKEYAGLAEASRSESFRSAVKKRIPGWCEPAGNGHTLFDWIRAYRDAGAPDLPDPPRSPTPTPLPPPEETSARFDAAGVRAALQLALQKATVKLEYRAFLALGLKLFGEHRDLFADACHRFAMPEPRKPTSLPPTVAAFFKLVLDLGDAELEESIAQTRAAEEARVRAARREAVRKAQKLSVKSLVRAGRRGQLQDRLALKDLVAGGIVDEGGWKDIDASEVEDMHRSPDGPVFGTYKGHRVIVKAGRSLLRLAFGNAGSRLELGRGFGPASCVIARDSPGDCALMFDDAPNGGPGGDVQHRGVGKFAMIETVRETAENRAAGVHGDAFDTLKSTGLELVSQDAAVANDGEVYENFAAGRFRVVGDAGYSMEDLQRECGVLADEMRRCAKGANKGDARKLAPDVTLKVGDDSAKLHICGCSRQRGAMTTYTRAKLIYLREAGYVALYDHARRAALLGNVDIRFVAYKKPGAGAWHVDGLASLLCSKRMTGAATMAADAELRGTLPIEIDRAQKKKRRLACKDITSSAGNPKSSA